MAAEVEEQMFHLPEVKVSVEPVQPYLSPKPPSHPTEHPSLVEKAEEKKGPRNVLTHQLGELSKTLVFSEDALFSLSSVPAPGSYASACQASKQLFSHRTMSVPIKGRRRAAIVGRHSTRGPGSKHLPCHLTQSLPSGIKVEALGERRPHHATREGHRKELLLDGPIKEKGVSATAAKGSTDNLVGEGPTGNTRAFVEHLEAGAKPCHLLRGELSTIMLDDNTMFKKVLQPRFPPPPSKFHQIDEDSKTISEVTSERPVAFLQGHRRWLDLPQLVKVSPLAIVQLRCTNSTIQGRLCCAVVTPYHTAGSVAPHCSPHC
jgi:hypothetical protein